MTTEGSKEGNQSRRGNNGPQSDRGGFALRVLMATAVVAVVSLIILFLGYAFNVLLLIFAGILLAVFLRGMSDCVSTWSRLPERLSLALVIFVLTGAAALFIFLFSPRIADQAGKLAEELPRSVEQISEKIMQNDLGRRILRQTPSSKQLVEALGDLMKRAKGFFSTTLGIITGVLIILFIGLYVAFDPKLYVRGIVRLVPIHRRGRAREILGILGDTMKWWIIGRVFSMVVIGILSMAAYWLIGVPLAFALGLLAGLLTFIPYIGPFLSLIPAVLLALTISPYIALYVVLAYLGIQTLESYILTPLVQQKTVLLPPALTLAAQVALGTLFGFLGILLASPLAAAALVLVKLLYIEEALGDKVKEIRTGH